MLDLTSLPRFFKLLLSDPPDNLKLRDKVLEPCALIEKNGTLWSAHLSGTFRFKGKEKLLKAPSNGHSWVLDDETIFPLPEDSSEIFNELLQGNSKSTLSYVQVRKLLSEDNPLIQVRLGPDEFLSGKSAADLYPEQVQIEGLKASLYSYQAKGIQWLWDTLSSNGGAILADEMGLGKTMQVIAILLLSPPLRESPALIICPTSLIANWVREFETFAPSLTVMVHKGPTRTGIFRGLQRTNVVITTYGTMVSDITLFSSFTWKYVVCDEAQAIKNPESNRRECISRIPLEKSLPMTGTPVENSLVDLWSLVDFATPGLLGNLSDFVKRFPDSDESAMELNSVVDPIILKRRVIEVANDLPERINIDIPINMSEEMQNLYKEVRERTLEKYPIAGALVATLQMQLLCTHPWLVCGDHDVNNSEQAEVRELPTLPLLTEKMEITVRLLNEAFLTNKKVLIFSVFNRMDQLIRRAGNTLPPGFWGSINGSTAQDERQLIIDKFSKFEGPGCLVLNPKAAGAGLNITAATVVIHISPVWNPALEAQASARAHRRGQKHPVSIYRLFYEDTVERVMLDRSIWRAGMGDQIAPMAQRDKQDLLRAMELVPGAQL